VADQFVAEVRIFAFNFPPTGWAFCSGQLMPISQNTALFSLLGTTYGGDGKSTFALPHVEGNAVMHPGQGSGLSLHDLGEESGSETVTLLQSEIPAHTHTVNASEGDGTERSPAAQLPATGISISQYQTQGGATTQLAPNAASISGSSFPHNNMAPYLTLNFCVALQGIFPQRP
jgi:microcystin-dependent protein